MVSALCGSRLPGGSAFQAVAFDRIGTDCFKCCGLQSELRESWTEAQQGPGQEPEFWSHTAHDLSPCFSHYLRGDF